MPNLSIKMFSVALIGSVLSACQPSSTNITIDYMGEPDPSLTATMFAPGKISKPDRWEGNINFSSDGGTVYFNVFDGPQKDILVSHRINGAWSDPAPFEVTGPSRDNWEPYISRDDQRFYFVSSRDPGTPDWNGRIWKTERGGDGEWGKAELLDFGLTTENGFWFPNESADQDLYFGGNFDQVPSKGKGDLHYWSRQENKVHNLSSLNTPDEEWDPFISPDGNILVWASDRPGGYGGTDIYLCYWNDARKVWGEPLNFGPAVNSDAYEVAPRISPDGAYLFFDRPQGGTQDIYWISMDIAAQAHSLDVGKP